MLNNYSPIGIDKQIASNAAVATKSTMQHLNYDEIVPEGQYLIARKERQFNKQGYEIGDMRICFEKVDCGPTTIIA